ncbi:LAMI_0C03576g1_1 [Lachancea mirantina]|uniref:LAMI_0C03576g1_1 n=1 Tax=Lachancea mirantina TaxID=1230905 RepID=A0A1G4J2E2_9SACH|nr:LAMI_0C03576g1_1 [Lachancea mirantina]
MSMFNALNFTPDEESLEIEQHSRELQIEECYRIFQDALLHLKEDRFVEADESFKELFSIEVLKPDKWGNYKHKSTTLDSLRYLSYRNRGIFHYRTLKANFRNMSAPDIVDTILKVLEDLLESIQHSEGDITVIRLLLDIFDSFRSDKLQRYILEYDLLRDPVTLNRLRRRQWVLPQSLQIFARYQDFLAKIKDEDTMRSEVFLSCQRFIKDYSHENPEPESFLAQIQEMKAQDDEALRLLDTFELMVPELSWEGVAESLVGALPKYKTSNFFGTVPDPYDETTDPIESIKLTICPTNNVISETSDKQSDFSSLPSKVNNAGGDEKSAETAPSNNVAAVEDKKRPSTDTADGTKPVQRASKRFKERPILKNDSQIMELHTLFWAEFRALSGDSDTQGIQIENFAPEDIPPNTPALIALTDLYDCLGSWTNRHSEFLNHNETKNASKSLTDDKSLFKLNALFRNSVFAEDSSPIPSLTDLPVAKVESFISSVNDGKMHFHEARILLLKELFSINEAGLCPIVDTFWSPVLFKTIEAFVLSIELNIYNLVCMHDSRSAYMGLSVYEMLVNIMGNLYMGSSQRKLQGQKTGEIDSQRNKLGKKIEKWSSLLTNISFQDVRSEYRFRWSRFCYLQYASDITDESLVNNLCEIMQDMEQNAHYINVAYANYVNIPRLDIKVVKNQLSRLQMIRRITTIDKNVSEEDEKSSESQMELLRSILIDEKTTKAGATQDELSLMQFIRNSPFLIKVKLWKLLFSFYARKDTPRVGKIYQKIMTILYEKLCSEDYKAQSQLQRQQTLLTTISFLGLFTHDFLQIALSTPPEKLYLPEENISFISLRDVLKVTVILLYPILFHETLSQKNPSLSSFFQKAVKSSTKMKGIFIDVLSLFIYLCAYNPDAGNNSKKSAQYVSSFIYASHSLMGHFDFCDSSNGVFLRLSQQILCNCPDEYSFIQLKQILWCMFHLSLSGESSTVVQHSTTPSDLNKESAIGIGRYLIKLQYQDRNPLMASGAKSNLKQFLDNVVQVIGDLDFAGNHVLCRNKHFLDGFLNSSITTKIVRSAFKGILAIELLKPKDKIQEAVEAGLFYVASVQALNLYKIRKKATQARPSELDSIIYMLRTDILYDSRRFESWFLLGKCYSYIVEDDLMWTSDKISADKRKGTVAFQRKALLCYLMALGLSASVKLPSNNKDAIADHQNILRELLEILSEEMLSGYLRPLDKLCYYQEWPSTVRISASGDLLSTSAYESPSISDYNVQQAIFLALREADLMYEDSSDAKNLRNWKNLFFKAKLTYKTAVHEFASSGRVDLLEACRLSQVASTQRDPILEPHYFLVSAIYKCVNNNVMSVKAATSTLSENNSFFKKSNDFWHGGAQVSEPARSKDRRNFLLQILDLLRTILTFDKMKWHHRPKFRIAKILFEDFQDLDGAITEMNEIIFLKSPNKSLVNIWKPDLERPGKHFLYTYQYVMFYLDLLFCKGDYESIVLVAKKLKRFGAGMVNMPLAADRAARLFSQCVQRQFSLNEKLDAEQVLLSLNYQNFLQRSDELFASFDKKNYDTTTVDLLASAYHLKKGNNAYDLICLAIYFKFFYKPFTSNDALSSKEGSQAIKLELPTVPAPVSASPIKLKTVSARKRVSKKDAFDKIGSLVDKKLT